MKNKSNQKRVIVHIIMLFCMMLFGLSFFTQDVQAAKLKTKQYTLSKEPGNYDSEFVLKISAKKLYRIYYTTGKNFSKGKMIKPGKSKKIKISKDTNLKIYYAKKNVTLTKKELKSSKVNKRAQKYFYHIQEALSEDGSYTSKEDVSLYLHTFKKLPKNFMTKEEARKLGWNGGGLDDYAYGYCIGGDHFSNYEGTLPQGEYHECDIDTLHQTKRGAKRLVYSDDGRIYYTEDHYDSFTLLYDGWAE